MTTCLCNYIGGSYILPGWGCCQCRAYNGLQRRECKHCGHKRHEIVPPDGVVQCPTCGWGYEETNPPVVVTQTRRCPSCAADGVSTVLP
jgi:hypothetical protein